MQMSGERLIAAPGADDGAALNAAEEPRACIPGFGEIERKPPADPAARVVQAAAPVKARLIG